MLAVLSLGICYKFFICETEWFLGKIKFNTIVVTTLKAINIREQKILSWIVINFVIVYKHRLNSGQYFLLKFF